MCGAVERVDEGGRHICLSHVRLRRLHQVEQIDQCAAWSLDHLFHEHEYGTLNLRHQRIYTMARRGRFSSRSGNVTGPIPAAVIESDT